MFTMAELSVSSTSPLLFSMCVFLPQASLALAISTPTTALFPEPLVTTTFHSFTPLTRAVFHKFIMSSLIKSHSLDPTSVAQSLPSSKPVSTTFYLLSQTFSNCPCRLAPFAPTSKCRSNTYPENAYSGQ